MVILRLPNRKEQYTLSFFDEADEPPAAPRRPPRGRRTGGSSRRPTGGGGRSGGGARRPPSEQQAILVRRAVAATAILILIIVVVLGIASCQANAHRNALRDYANNVSSLVQQSDQTGAQLFQQLSSGSATSGNAQTLQNQIDQTSQTADSQLSRAQGLSVPDEMRQANQNFILAMQMRRDGIADIAQQIQPALGTSTSKDAVNSIAIDMARFYASDVLYKGYTATLIVGALHAGGIDVGGSNGVQIEAGQFLPDIGWLTPSFVAGKLSGQGSTAAGGKPAPGLHGHTLNSVSVGGSTLQSGSSATLPASPAPTFALNITNGGQNTEHNVVCKVTVKGANVSGQTTIPQTSPGQSTTCNVQLSSSPPKGNYTVTATVEPVPGEKNVANNTLTFQVTFQ